MALLLTYIHTRQRLNTFVVRIEIYWGCITRPSLSNYLWFIVKVNVHMTCFKAESRKDSQMHWPHYSLLLENFKNIVIEEWFRPRYLFFCLVLKYLFSLCYAPIQANWPVSFHLLSSAWWFFAWWSDTKVCLTA